MNDYTIHSTNPKVEETLNRIFADIRRDEIDKRRKQMRRVKLGIYAAVVIVSILILKLAGL